MPRKLIALGLAAAAVLGAADSLSEAAAKRGIRIGAAVQSGYIATEPTYAATLAREYSMIEPEYEMLWSTIRPAANPSLALVQVDGDTVTARYPSGLPGRTMRENHRITRYENEVDCSDPRPPFPQIRKRTNRDV